MKKLLAVVMAVAMLLSLSIVAFANDNLTADQVDSDPYISALQAKLGENDTIRPTETAYYHVKDANLVDGDKFKFKASKDEGSKMIDSIKLVEKKGSDIGNAAEPGRGWYIAVKMKDTMTDAETKIASLWCSGWKQI